MGEVKNGKGRMKMIVGEDIQATRIYRYIMNSFCIVKSSFYMFLVKVSRDPLTQTAQRDPKGNLSAISCQSICQ